MALVQTPAQVPAFLERLTRRVETVAAETIGV